MKNLKNIKTRIKEIINRPFAKLLVKIRYPIIKKYSNENYFTKQQDKILKKLLKTAKNTEFWKKFHFNKILKDNKNFKEYFREEIPIFTYEKLSEYIEKTKQRDNILWTRVDKFSVSSGTTSAKKTIPVSKEALKSTRKAGIDSIIMYLKAYPWSKILSAYQRPLWWSLQETLDNGKILGDISAHIISDRWSFSKSRYLFNIRTLLLNNRQEKRKRKLKEFNENKTTVMYWVTSWIAEMIKTIQEKEPKKFKTFLKNLDWIVRWGVDIKPFEKFFDNLWIQQKMGVYNASEGFFAIQDIVNYKDKNSAPYILLPNHGIYYEFIAFNENNFDNNWELKKEHKTTPRQEIKTKQKYALIISTNAGLRRYLLGDIITFDEKKRFYITWRTKQSLNLKGEELMITHTEEAIRTVNKELNTNINHYIIWPEKNDNPNAHRWIIESELDPKSIQTVLDKKLQELNNDYKAKRKDNLLLNLPKIDIVKKWTFNKRLTKKGKLWWQNKIPKLVNTTEKLKEIIEIEIIPQDIT